MLPAGTPLPDFELDSDRGTRVSRAGLLGQRYLLYFYPKDDTPGCTREACAFRDALPRFEQLGVPVYGVSADSVAAHQKFVRKHGLNFPLLADPQHQLLQPLGAWVEKSMYGRKYHGVARVSVLVDAAGVIEQVWEKVKPDSHAAEVHDWLAGPAR